MFWMALSAAVVGGFESAVWAMLRVRTRWKRLWQVVRTPVVEEQK